MKSKLDEKQSIGEEKNLTYTINSEQKIVYENIRGFLKLEELIEFKKNEAADPDFNPTFSVITDFQKASFEFSQKEIGKTIQFFNKNYQNHLSFHKCALITSKPIQVVVSKLFELKIKKLLKGQFKIFSSYKTALSWIIES